MQSDFETRPITRDLILNIMSDACEHRSIGQWKLFVVTNKDKMSTIIQVWRKKLRKLDWNMEKLDKSIASWKDAACMVILCLPVENHFLREDPVASYEHSLIELGMALNALLSQAETKGIGSHRVIGSALASVEIGSLLEIPKEYKVLSFFVLGYARKGYYEKLERLERPRIQEATCFIT